MQHGQGTSSPRRTCTCPDIVSHLTAGSVCAAVRVHACVRRTALRVAAVCAQIAAIKAELDSDSARRSTLFDLNKPLASHSQHALHALHCGDMAAAQAALEAARPIATKVGARGPACA